MAKKKIEDMATGELIFTLLANRVGSVDPKEVFYSKQVGKTGKYACFLGGKKLTENQLQQLQAEAKALRNMGIWKLFEHTLNHEAQLRMFKNAKTERDMDWGKAIMHSVAIIQAIVRSIAEGQVIHNEIID